LFRCPFHKTALQEPLWWLPTTHCVYDDYNLLRIDGGGLRVWWGNKDQRPFRALQCTAVKVRAMPKWNKYVML